MTYYIKFDGISGTSGNGAYVGYCKIFAFEDDGDGSIWFRMSFAKGSSALFSACADGTTIPSAVLFLDEEGSILMKTRYSNVTVSSAQHSKKGNSFGIQYGSSTTDYPQWSSD